MLIGFQRVFRLVDRMSGIEKALGSLESKVTVMDEKFQMFEKALGVMESKVSVMEKSWQPVWKTYNDERLCRREVFFCRQTLAKWMKKQRGTLLK